MNYLSDIDKLEQTKKSESKIGVAFSGGGAKGYVHIGVIKAFEEYGLKFDQIAGTSAGSIVGAFYAAGCSWKRMYEIGRKLKTNDIKKRIIIPSSTEGIQKLLINELGNINIEDLKIPFTAVAVDIKSLKECAISSGNLAKACAGSCSVPGVFEPVKLDDKWLCDGGLKNSLPADVLKQNGCDYIISVDISGEKQGAKSSKVLDVLSCALEILIADNSYKGILCSDLVIKPKTQTFSPKRISKVSEMVEEGYRATIEVMPQILEIFSKVYSQNMVFDYKGEQQSVFAIENIVTSPIKNAKKEMELIK